MNGKLNLETGDLYVICHNDQQKKNCDGCSKCKDPLCSGLNCDVHKNCQCIRTQCLCMGRYE